MLIVALVLAVIGLAALITAVVTSNELIAWVCIGASGLGILLLIADAIRERARRPAPAAGVAVAAPAAEPEITEITEIIEPVERVDTVDVVDIGEAESLAGTEDLAVHEVDYEPVYEPVDAAEDLSISVEDHPEELVHDEPDYDLPSDDEAEFPEPAEEAALHIVSDDPSERYVDDEYTQYEEYAESGESGESGVSAEPRIEYVAEYTTETVTEIVTEPVTETVTEIGQTVAAEVSAVGDSAVGDSSTEIRYIPSAEGSADTVYTYSESTEVTDERRIQ